MTFFDAHQIAFERTEREGIPYEVYEDPHFQSGWCATFPINFKREPYRQMPSGCSISYFVRRVGTDEEIVDFVPMPPAVRDLDEPEF